MVVASAFIRPLHRGVEGVEQGYRCRKQRIVVVVPGLQAWDEHLEAGSLVDGSATGVDTKLLSMMDISFGRKL